MKRKFTAAWLVPILVIAGLFAGTTAPVLASQAWPEPSVQLAAVSSLPKAVILLSPIADIKLGDSFTVSGSLADAYGKPIANQGVLISMGGAYLGQAATDQNGHFERQFTKSLSAGIYTIQASVGASQAAGPAEASISVKILPADVQVQTVPPIAGIPFQIGNQTFYSGDDGMAYAYISTPGNYRLSIQLDQYSNPSLRVEFGRWLQETSQTYQDIQVPDKQVIQVGLNVYLSVGQNFVDLDGYPVDPSRVSELTIRSAQGDIFVFQSGQPHWIPSSRVTRYQGGLVATQLLYSVLSVMVDGSNVVNQSQQRFYSHPDGSWPISLQLYSMQVTARDALFGFPVGTSVKVTYPDGQIISYPLDRTGKVEIHSLARGNYFTTLVGTHGINVRTPVALSRSQVLNGRVITLLDLAVVGSLGALLALGLLFYGRPNLLPRKRRSMRESQFAYAEGTAKEDDAGRDKKIIRWS